MRAWDTVRHEIGSLVGMQIVGEKDISGIGLTETWVVERSMNKQLKELMDCAKTKLIDMGRMMADDSDDEDESADKDVIKENRKEVVFKVEANFKKSIKIAWICVNIGIKILIYDQILLKSFLNVRFRKPSLTFSLLV